jgi:hypothetical protein
MAIGFTPCNTQFTIELNDVLLSHSCPKNMEIILDIPKVTFTCPVNVSSKIKSKREICGVLSLSQTPFHKRASLDGIIISLRLV